MSTGSKFLFGILALALIGTLIIPSQVAACPSCYGNLQSPRSEGVNSAIMAMLGITGMVLTGISTFFFVVMRRRVRIYRSSLPNSTYVNEKGTLEWNNS